MLREVLTGHCMAVCTVSYYVTGYGRTGSNPNHFWWTFCSDKIELASLCAGMITSLGLLLIKSEPDSPQSNLVGTNPNLLHVYHLIGLH